MAHYAFLDENNVVTEVIVGKDENDGGVNWEEFYGNIRGQVCKRTSYNTRGGVHLYGGAPAFRKNYASIGYTYDYNMDAFVPPKPYPSWTLDTDTCLWVPPTPMPTDDNAYAWDEGNQTWVNISPTPENEG